MTILLYKPDLVKVTTKGRSKIPKNLTTWFMDDPLLLFVKIHTSFWQFQAIIRYTNFGSKVKPLFQILVQKSHITIAGMPPREKSVILQTNGHGHYGH